MYPKNSVLLHICCGPCAVGAVKQLQNEGYHVIGYFFNPNIYPKEEYLLRKASIEKIENILQAKILKEEYMPRLFYTRIQGFEKAKEGKERCTICFRMRLEKTFLYAKKNNIDFFTSTLSISPHKNFEAIKRIGMSINKEKFLAKDFKKKDGFKISMELAKELNLYRQSYCGCEFSMR